MKGIPLAVDLVKTPAERAVLEVIFARQTMAYPFAAPPDVPPERLAALRSAFAATMADPAFIAEASMAGMSVNPVSHEEMTRIIERVYASPPELVAQVKAAMGLDAAK